MSEFLDESAPEGFTITAKFAGKCACCFDPFEVGAIIVSTEDGWILEDHIGLDVAPDPADFCNKCFMQKSVSGACLCD